MATMNLTKDGFEKITSYTGAIQGNWEYIGNKPAVIDFYAPWCGPCKMLSPILEELSEEYSGQIDIYKVNVDNEEELSALLEIRSVPTLFFIPMQSEPQKAVGALSKQQLKKIFEDFLLQH
ncbi:MAG: thioredoxin [Bacteroidaceae bacterium]|nr:thioredoxin [Bacteroidaceae bacterium]